MLLQTLFLDALALVGGTVHPMTPGSTPAVATVLIEDGRVTAVGQDLELPEGAKVVDVSGLHVIPGLIDGLVYHDPEHDGLYTAAGVTLVRDHGNDLARILQSRESEARDAAVGPALSISGAVLDGYPPSTPTALVLRDAAQADAVVPNLITEGVDFLSVQIGLPEPAWKEVLALAHPDDGKRLQVWGPLPKAVKLDELIARGQDGLLFLDALVPEGKSWESVAPEELDAAVAALAKAHVRVTPLLRGTARLSDPIDADAPQLDLLSSQYVALWRHDQDVRRELASTYAERSNAVLAKQEALLARMHAAGVVLVPGSGAPHPWLMPGSGLVNELELWQAAGIPPSTCLELATSGAARALELEDRGTLAAGAIADVVVVDGDPEKDVAALGKVRDVVLRGRLLERGDLDKLVEATRQVARAQREEAEKPIDVAEPSLPAGTVLLSGYAETSGAGGRIAGERWAIVREPDNDVDFCGRRLIPEAGVEVEVSQTLRGKTLVAFAVKLHSAGHEIAVRGELVAGQMRVERRMDGGFVDTKAARERLVALDVSSVTTLMLIANAHGEGPMPILRFDEALELEVVRWDLALQADGGHWLRTPTGRKFAAFRPTARSRRRSTGRARRARRSRAARSTTTTDPGCRCPRTSSSACWPRRPRRRRPRPRAATSRPSNGAGATRRPSTSRPSSSRRRRAAAAAAEPRGDGRWTRDPTAGPAARAASPRRSTPTCRRRRRASSRRCGCASSRSGRRSCSRRWPASRTTPSAACAASRARGSTSRR